MKISNIKWKLDAAWGMIALAVCFFATFPAAAEEARVLVTPFKMNADRELGFLRDGIFDMMSTRLTHPGEVSVAPREAAYKAVEKLSGPLNEGMARELGAELGADYVVYGSLTVFGDSVSIDAKALEMSGMNPPLTFFNQSKGMDEVIPKIDEISAQINHKLFGKQAPSAGYANAPPQGLAPAPQQPGQSIYAHPERMWEQEMGGQAMVSGEGSPFIINRPGDVSGFRKSRNFEFEIEGLAIGDLTGDGFNETVLMTSQKLYIFRTQGGRMADFKEIQAQGHQTFVSVDAADIKKNDRAEIFVTCLNANTKLLDSFALEWDGSDFQHVATGQKWYFRVIDHPVLGKILAGQKRGLEDLFMPGIYHLEWDGRDYVDQDKLPVPKGLIVYGFALGDPLNQGGEMTAAMDSEGRIKIFTSGGSQEWKSDEKYGGSEKFLKYIGTDRVESDNRMFLPQRIFILDSNKDGKNEVLVVKNEALTGRLFKNYRHYSSGAFQALTWDGLGLTPFWQTQKISGYVSDYELADMNNDGQKDLVAAVVTKRDKIFWAARSTVIFYDMSSLSETKVGAK